MIIIIYIIYISSSSQQCIIKVGTVSENLTVDQDTVEKSLFHHLP